MGSCFSLVKSEKDEGAEERPLPGTNDAVDIRRTLTELRQNPIPGLYVFNIQEMEVATRKFSAPRILGQGGTAMVYRGKIDNMVREAIEPMDVVAIKVIAQSPSGESSDELFLNELNFLGQLRHPYLVKVIGYCCDASNRILVYEYMTSGTLHEHLFSSVDQPPLSWHQRFKIALDVAIGLAFIHSAPRPIVMLDLKPANILLDGEFNAKLSDFGIAKEEPVGNELDVTPRRGTFGYVDPVYYSTGVICAKCDVYGFGVLLLELLSGRKAVDNSIEDWSIVTWGRPMLKKSLNIMRSSLLDTRLSSEDTPEFITKIGKLAFECLQSADTTAQMARPDMKQVLRRLKAAVGEV